MSEEEERYEMALVSRPPAAPLDAGTQLRKGSVVGPTQYKIYVWMETCISSPSPTAGTSLMCAVSIKEVLIYLIGESTFFKQNSKSIMTNS
jgi:hypothetical protein